MSVVRPVLNAWLRWTEKPYLARLEEPAEIREAFERKAKVYFHAPFGTTWRDLTIGGRPGLEIMPGADGPTVLYFHGGGYVFGSPATHAAMLAWLCRETGGRAILPDYRKAPEHRFPAAVEDAQAAWLDLLAAGEDPGRIVIGGDSAGGGLALALLGLLLAKRHPLPAGVFAFSPLTDLTYSGESVARNADAEVLLPAARTHELAEMYLGDADPRDPKASPLFATFEGAPPVFLAVGDTEILLDDSIRLADRLQDQGVEVTMEKARDLPHVWPIFHNTLPEARATLRRVAAWIKLL
jgi:monoterpene epsilon-lactone hydrolase